MKADNSKITLRSWLERGPFTLCLSSGFFGFFAHAGVISVLEDEGLLPSALRGSSAGALISGLWASGVSAQELKESLFKLDKASFWDPGVGLGLLKGERFDRLLDQLLKCERFEETRCPLSITAFHCFKLRGVSLVKGSLRDAIRASCSYPGLFQPKWIDGAPYLDGGITDRPGTLGLKEEERVLYHHLASRSRWRGALGLTQIPSRSGQVSLCLSALPRCGPSRLDVGPSAYEAARVQTIELLDKPMFPYGAKEETENTWLCVGQKVL